MLQKELFLNAVKKFGTPLYVYDADIIRRQISYFKEAFSAFPLQVRYAMKSNSNISILKLMLNEGVGLDTVSVPEIQTGLLMGFQPEQIVFTPNLVDFNEIKEAVKLGTYINIENLSNLEKFGREYGSSRSCFIRLNPHIIAESQTKKVADWHSQSKFGISLTQFDKLHDIISRYGIMVDGIHLHSSHVIMKTEIFQKGAEIIFNLAEEFPNLKYIDFGGGIKVPHYEGEKVIDLKELGMALRPQYDAFCRKTGRKIELWFEPGRFLVGESGTLLTQVKVLKTNGPVDFAGVDSGFNHLIRPMFYDSYHEILNISNPEGKLKRYTVVGNLCEIDNFAKNRPLNEIREDDILAITHAGGYGYSMASQYNSRFRPAEVMISGDNLQLIRKRDTLDDLLRNQIEINFEDGSA